MGAHLECSQRLQEAALLVLAHLALDTLCDRRNVAQLEHRVVALELALLLLLRVGPPQSLLAARAGASPGPCEYIMRARRAG